MAPVLPRLLAQSLDTTYSLNTVISSSPRKGVYNPRTFVPHAVLLCQAFAHCRRFPTAASRRSFDRVSVQMWLIILADQRLIEALVRSYRTNKLIRNKLILKRLISWSAAIVFCPRTAASPSSLFKDPERSSKVSRNNLCTGLAQNIGFRKIRRQ